MAQPVVFDAAFLDSAFARRVRAMANGGTLSHALILSGSGDLTAAGRYVAAAHLCREKERPCLKCNVCRKVLSDIHPDVITVRDDDRRELAVEKVRELKQEVYIRPNEGQRKVYLFADCGQLNERDQNVLLKIVEEGPAYAVFLFCAPSAHALLSTIRSRCVELKLDGEAGDEDLIEPAALCKAVGSGSAAALAQHLVGLENSRIKREALETLLQGAWRITAEALLARAGKAPQGDCAHHIMALSRLQDGQLAVLESIFRRYAAECVYNVGPGHVLGALLAEIQQEVIR